MFEFLTEIFKAGGLLALIEAIQVVALVYLFRALRQKEAQLLNMSEKRLKDVTESKEDYEELAKNLDKSIDLLIKVFKKQNGN